MMFYVFLLYAIYQVECFYVPAMAPHEFKSGESIELKVPDFFLSFDSYEHCELLFHVKLTKD